VDASNEIGMGHLMESISLAESLKKMTKCEIVFLTRYFRPSLDILEQHGYRTVVIRGKSEETEIAQIIQTIKKTKMKVLIVDLLNKKNGYFQKLKGLVKVLVVILDDDKHRKVPADIVVNFNIVQNKKFYQNLGSAETIYCIGPEYMPMPDYMHYEWKKNKIIPKKCKMIFVNQGGSDPFGLTAKIIRSLEILNLGQKIVVVVGPAVSPRLKKELLSLKPHLKNYYVFKWRPNQEEMHQIMKESDLAITAAGNTLYELSVFGVPSIVICHHKKHNAVAKKFAQRNAIINLGIGKNISNQTIANSVKKLLSDHEKRVMLSNNAKKITDGKGSERVSKIIICYLKTIIGE
jgi:UDP-2,4-diacetamido-2,4,6-trideoxy-beta-L-altropyranose hydrolase